MTKFTSYFGRVALFILLTIAFFRGETELMVFLFAITLIVDELQSIKKLLEDKHHD